ncbi:MAG: hypothetical protein OXC31_21900 [Spirochaetaceae bacterium]|nr:hypothetical protein [Spirochaetaceae bacterium]
MPNYLHGSNVDSGSSCPGRTRKASKRWDRRYNRGLTRIRDELGANRVTCYGVYDGERPASWGAVQVLPALEFLQLLWNGQVVR